MNLGADPSLTLTAWVTADAPAAWHRGSAAYTRASLALFLVGFATFSLLYCVQPVLPEFARAFRVPPAAAALALSLATAALAAAIFASAIAAAWLPQRALIGGGIALAALCNLAAAAAPSWPLLLAARLCEGLALGGVPAVAMAVLAEAVPARDLGRAMGRYVAGTAFGGMAGRVGMGLIVAAASWRVAMALFGVLGLAAALGFALLLPPVPRGAAASRLDPRVQLRRFAHLLANSRLRRLFATGFVLMSVFVTLFNYAGFRLLAAPFALGPTAISLLFLSYISGIFVSPLAGALADRFGARLPLAGAQAIMAAGVALTCAPGLAAIGCGILLVTLGFFAAHAIASGWVGRLGGDAKGHASALYLLGYYLGASVTGAAGGWFWQHFAWPGVAALTGGLALAGTILALTIRD